MEMNNYSFQYQVVETAEKLAIQDFQLMETARKVAESAYAPYSKFYVGAAALLQNGAIVTGTNQENASYPVGICAERSLLATAANLHPNIPIVTMAITYHNHNALSNKPVAPCGMCRQSLLEYEIRQQQSFRLLLSGVEGNVIVIEKASMLLPLSFTKHDLL